MVIKFSRSVYVFTIMVSVLAIICTAVGLFYKTGGESYLFTNLYGDQVKIYGNGLYAYDSFFKAPIFRGTDFAMLFFAIPLLIISLIYDVKKKSLKTRMFLISLLGIFMYYSTSISLGVTYNMFHLVYITFFSVTLFGFITAIRSVEIDEIPKYINEKVPTKGIYIFLMLTGIALFIAWLPDILAALEARRPLALIETYTTEITNVIDMGIISPLAFITFYLLKKRAGLGFVLLQVLLTCCGVMGVILPCQTLFQVQAGIDLPVPVIVTKVGIFILLALFSFYFDIKLMKSNQG